MTQPAICIRQLSKRYQIGSLVSKYDYRTFRDVLTDAALWPVRQLRRGARGTPSRAGQDTLWALKDVSFDVQAGETIGIIGRNGAGKSTLLKILSRITEPTSGEIELNGRVASLLEVGTGFHPELTGRENIYLNGAIMGMTRREIDTKFDEIVAFSEMERFIETPVKRFSSGQYLRLAFAVAAHLEPEILVVDEVLAVGDVAFQRKCLGKMESVASQGRTVLFVSHNLPVMRQLCSRGVLLRAGEVVRTGPIHDVVDEYVSDVKLETEVHLEPRGGKVAQFARLCLRNDQGELANRLAHSEPFTAELEFVVHERIQADRLWWGIFRSDGDALLISSELDDLRPRTEVREPGRYLAQVRFPGGILNAGTYRYGVSLAAVGGAVRDNHDGFHFEVYDDTDLCLNSGGRRLGSLLLRLDWDERRLD
jgi:lipopolysaccharide transport system ATP-binding protein